MSRRYTQTKDTLAVHVAGLEGAMTRDLDAHGRTIAKCRWCGAAVRWVVMVPSGKKNPLDPDPVPNGNVILEQHGTGLAKALKRDEAFDGPRYLSHWATCPSAAQRRAQQQAQARMFDPGQ